MATSPMRAAANSNSLPDDGRAILRQHQANELFFAVVGPVGAGQAAQGRWLP